MTELDRQLGQLADLIDPLSRRSQAAIFWAASAVHSGSVRWRAVKSEGSHALLVQAQGAAYAFCLGSSLADQGPSLLDRLDRALPEDVAAQSAWICAETALRIAVDDTFDSGMSIEYALEPVIGNVSEELFGFWQVGSGEYEVEQVADIMNHPDVVSAVGFIRWAAAELADSDPSSAAVLEELRAEAGVLAARRSSA